MDAHVFRRRHADDLERRPVEGDGTADDAGVGPERAPPEAVRDHGDGVRARVLFRHEPTAQHGTNPEHVEIVRAHRLREQALALAALGQRHRRGGPGREAGERVHATEVEVVRIRRRPVQRAAEVAREDGHDLGRPRHRHRAQEQRVHEAEDRGVGADAESERHHGDRGEARMLHEKAHGLAEVVSERCP